MSSSSPLNSCVTSKKRKRRQLESDPVSSSSSQSHSTIIPLCEIVETDDPQTLKMMNEIKFLRKQVKEYKENKSIQNKCMENLKDGVICKICFKPSKVLTSLPCERHTACFHCINQHVQNTCILVESEENESGFALDFKHVTCPFCKSGPYITDEMTQVHPPMGELLNYHHSFIKHNLYSCPYCFSNLRETKTIVEREDHIRYCKERKHKCPMPGCTKMYKPLRAGGFQSHLLNDCTGYSCDRCHRSGLTYNELNQDISNHFESERLVNSCTKHLIKTAQLVQELHTKALPKLELVQTHLSYVEKIIYTYLLSSDEKVTQPMMYAFEKFHQYMSKLNLSEIPLTNDQMSERLSLIERISLMDASVSQKLEIAKIISLPPSVNQNNFSSFISGLTSNS